MVTAVGLDAPSSCAAMRAGITGFVETRFLFAGEWLIGSPVPLENGSLGRDKLLQMLVPALRECLASCGGVPQEEIPLFLALSEPDRPGRLSGADETLLRDAAALVGSTFHRDSSPLSGGRTAGAYALDLARRAVEHGRPLAIVAGVDSYLVSDTLYEFERRRRILTAENSDGFIPGEAAAAVLVGSSTALAGGLRCLGIGFAQERASIDAGEPLKGEGLAHAFRAALADGRADWPQVHYQIASVSGEQYGFKEAALAGLKTIRPVKETFDLWHPSDCIGEVGAAIVPCMLGVAWTAARKRYAPGSGVLCHASDDDGRRAAIVLRDWSSPD
jgi:3-oxoacyl-[acyl-carrier-protein] synthase-1